MKGSINSIETYGAVDGPGVRLVVFLNGCSLRCKYCHNPEMWGIGQLNYTVEELVDKISRYQTYFKNNGGVTFSGGEPLLQSTFLEEVTQKLKNMNIHTALDTAGIYNNNIEELIKNIDLIIYDIKDINEERYHSLTGGDITTTWSFLKLIKKLHKKVWIRQVIVPNIHDNLEYLINLNNYIKKHFEQESIEKIEFLPYHKLGSEKYQTLGIPNLYEQVEAMDNNKCKELYEQFMTIYNNEC